MRFNSLDEWLAWLEKPHISSINLGLDRVKKISDHLKINKFKSKVVTVAGTNGKGSTIRALNAILELPHKKLKKPRIGIYTSPHLINFNERIIVNGKSIDELDLVKAFEQIDQCRIKLDISLTYFEFTTLAAFLIFSNCDLDYILLEVGLGGKLDAVNIVDADLAIITSIGIDHQEWLGDSREQIAYEKAGILRERKLCIISDLDPPQSLKKEIKKLNCEAFFLTFSDLTPKNFKYEIDSDTERLSLFGYDKNDKKYYLNDLPSSKLSVESWSAAFQASILLDAIPSYSNLSKIITKLTLKGRQQHLYKNKREIILDVAHNPQSVEYLIKHLNASSRNESNISKFVAIFACMKDKDFKQMIYLMNPLIKKWYFPILQNNPRAICPQKLEDSQREIDISPINRPTLEPISNIEISKSVKDSLINAIHKGSQNDRIVVFGSFYIVAEAILFLEDLS